MSFEDAIRQYQAQHPVSTQAYEGMYDYLRNLGYQVERPTHAGGRLPSDDKIVDARTGRIYDVVRDSDKLGTGGGAWTLGTGREFPYWVNGRPSRTPPPGVAGAPGTPSGGGGHQPSPGAEPTGDIAVPRGTFGQPPYASAYDAQRRQRRQAGVGGRSGTILGGFRPGTPRTRPALLGRG